MSLLSPWALWLLPLVGLPFLLTRKRIDRPPLRVSALTFWREAMRDTPERVAPKRRLDWLTVLQAAFLLLLIAALAGPVIARSRVHVVFVVDTSFSMQARERSGSRIEVARARARDVAASLPRGAQVRTIETGSTPPAMVADRVHVEDRQATVYVLTDAPAPSSTTARWIRIGSALPNVAITSLLARLDDHGQVRIAAEVRNFSTEPRLIDLELSGPGLTTTRHPATLGPAAGWTVNAVAPGGTSVTARLVGNADALPADDQRSTLVAPARSLRVSLPDQTDTFIAQAVRTNPMAAVVAATAADVVVCAPCATVPAGDRPVLFMPAAPERAAAPLPLQGVAGTHAVLRSVDLTDVVAVPVSMPDQSALPLITAGATPIVALSAAGRRIARLNVDLRDPAFALQPAFPVLIANLLEWLGRSDLSAADDANVPPSESNLWLDATGNTPNTDGPLQASTEPVRLQSLLIVAALVVLLLETRLRQRRGRAWRLPIRLAIAGLAVAAATGLRLPLGHAVMDVVVAFDQSSSLPRRSQQEAVARLDAMTRTRPRGDRVGALVFGGDVAIDRRPTSQVRPIAPHVVAAPGATNIEAAVDVAIDTLRDADAPRVVLASDGHQTSGDVIRAARRAATAGIPIDVVPVGPAQDTGASVRFVTAPPRAKVGEPFRLDIGVTGKPATHANVTVATDDGQRLSRDVLIADDGYGQVAVTQKSERAGTYWYRAWIDEDEAGDAPGAAVVVTGVPSMLLVGGGTALPNPGGAGYAVSRVAVGGLPTVASALRGFDVVVLSGVAPRDLTPARASALVEYIRDGGGLVVLGGPELTQHTAGASALDAVLPIDLRPRQGRRGEQLAYVLLVDTSGSMADVAAGIPKIELARRSVLQVLDVIPQGSAIGVVAFAARPSVVAPLATGGQRDAIGSALRALSPGGATSVAPALDVATGWLRSSTASRKRVLLISDGRTSGADADRLRATARSRAFELSVVAIGADADRGLLREVAASSGGHAYFPSDLTALPDIVAADATEAAGGGSVEERFTPIPSPHAVLAGIDTTSLPALAGYVVGAARPGATTILASHLGDPVLAAAPEGLGRIAMYTGGLDMSWSATLRQWRDASRMWLQTIRWAERRTALAEMDVSAVETDAGVGVYVEGPIEPDAPLIAIRNGSMTVRLPDGTFRTAALQPDANGRYTASIETAALGPIVIDVTGTSTLTGDDFHVARAFVRSGVNERAASGVNLPLLQQIATVSGGRVLANGETPFTGPRPLAFHDAAPWCSGLALMLFLFELLVSSRRSVRRQPASRQAA